ncbi:MAG: tetratricopeptide repeat protein [Bacteroidales bacterium]|nr:tetratricopeptide repeat protein [Bacteroidales bacterium]
MSTQSRYLLLLLVVLLTSCSTQSTKWINVKYHNICCHYNVWWNGNESLKEGVAMLEKKHQDDYTQILPVYKLGTKEQAMTCYTKFDRTMEKGIKGIKKHSIYQKGREHVDYVRNCYLITAYASFYKQDYPAAENTCRLIVAQYGGTPVADEARILMARCASQKRQYIDAEATLEQLVNEYNQGNISSKKADKLYLAMVEALLPQEKYKKSVQYIQLALAETRSSATKARLYFILGQIYQTLDKRATATKYFDKVLDCHPDYIMEFNARISKASCSDLNHTDIVKQTKELDRMIKDKKNEEFLDQIYYAKGEMYLGMKDATKACDNYKQSVAISTTNKMQKAKSSLRLADVLYEVYENYDLAQCYYDTAMHIINKGYPHYEEIADRHSLLTSLVEYTRLIHRNDSLMAMADMEPSERMAMIQKRIEALKHQEEEARQKALLDELAADAKAQSNTLEGDWYFYNSNTVSKGKETFRSRWGTRLLEDYWFLSKKSTLSMSMASMLPGSDDEDEEESAADTTAAAAADTTKHAANPKDDPNDPHCVAYYLKDLPTTIEQRDTMHRDIARSLLSAGYLYYDGIHNTDKALECYLRLANEYPDNDDIVQAFFQLYRIYSKQGNTPNANYYRDMVLMGFPDCDYANIIRDDQYYKQIIQRDALAEEEYASVYSNYRRRRYGDVIGGCATAMETYPQSALFAKFQYWQAMAYAQTGQRDSALTIFRRILVNNPDTSQIYILASSQLDYFNHGEQLASNDEPITDSDEQAAKERESQKVRDAKQNAQSSQEGGEDVLPPASQLFRYRETMQHYVIVIVNDKNITATQLQYRIGDFNMENYANSGYRCSPMLFTDSTQMITIHRYKNAQEALDYYTHILLPGGPLSQYDPKDYTVFAISTQNYTTFYNKKDIEAYRLFFEKYYLQK